MNRIVAIFLMLMSIQTYCQESKVDSLLRMSKDMSLSDSIRYDYYSKYTFEIIYQFPDSAIKLCEQTLKELQGKDLPWPKCDLTMNIGSTKGFLGDLEGQFEYYQKALEIAEESNYFAGIAMYHLNIGTHYNAKGELDKSIRAYKRTLELGEQYNYHDNDHNALHNLAFVYASIGDFENSLKYNHQSLGIRLAKKDTLGMTYSFNSISGNFTSMEMYDSSLYYLRNQIELGEAIGEYRVVGYALMNIADVKMKLSEFDSIPFILERARESFTKVSDYPMLELGLIWEGNYYNLIGNHNRAIECCSSLKDTIDMPSNAGLLPDIYNCLYTGYKGLGMFDSALKYMELREGASDPTMNIRTVEELKEFEAEKQALKDSLEAAQEMALLESEHSEAISKKKISRNLFLFGGIGAIIIAILIFLRLKKTRREKEASEEILDNILPTEISEELKEKGKANAKNFDQATILFSDFKGFTQLSEQLSGDELVAEINTCFEAFDNIVEKHGIEKIKTIGDAYMAAGGLPDPEKGTPDVVINVALEMQDFISKRKEERDAEGLPAFEMRIGIHTGPVVAGIVGVKKYQYDVWGDTVNTASRMESSGEVGKVNISGATYEVVKDISTFDFDFRGKVEAKGKGEMEMYFVSKR